MKQGSEIKGWKYVSKISYLRLSCFHVNKDIFYFRINQGNQKKQQFLKGTKWRMWWSCVFQVLRERRTRTVALRRIGVVARCALWRWWPQPPRLSLPSLLRGVTWHPRQEAANGAEWVAARAPSSSSSSSLPPPRPPQRTHSRASDRGSANRFQEPGAMTGLR